MAELPSIIAIIPGVERTLDPIVPPTSVSSRSATTNSSIRSSPGLQAGAHTIPSPPLTPSVSPVT